MRAKGNKYSCTRTVSVRTVRDRSCNGNAVLMLWSLSPQIRLPPLLIQHLRDPHARSPQCFPLLLSGGFGCALEMQLHQPRCRCHHRRREICRGKSRSIRQEHRSAQEGSMMRWNCCFSLELRRPWLRSSAARDGSMEAPPVSSIIYGRPAEQQRFHFGQDDVRVVPSTYIWLLVYTLE